MGNKLRVGILGATGMVGQKFITLLENHPWFEVVLVGASSRSKGKKYNEAVQKRWKQQKSIPENIKDLTLYSVFDDVEEIKEKVDFVFSAIETAKEEIKKIEETYAKNDIPVVSNNSAHRWTFDVPMIIPEINPHHTDMIDIQRKNRAWKKGFIAVKPNCSIQSYTPIIKALEEFKPKKAIVSTYQAISGAGKDFDSWPEIVDNIVPFISGEEEKSEKEPLKILATIKNNQFILSDDICISANCIRVPVLDGHMATCNISFQETLSEKDFIDKCINLKSEIDDFNLPSAPKPFIQYLNDDTRPQTNLDRDFQNGMGISFGRLRKDNIFDWKFVSLSHNTIRGAAGGAILLAELLKAKAYL